MDKYDGEILKIFYDSIAKVKKENNYITVTGLAEQARFDPDKLESHREELEEILDSIIPEGSIVKSDQLKYDINGDVWGTNTELEMLLLLGRGLNLLEFTKNSQLPEEKCSGLPYVTRVKIKSDYTKTLKNFKIVNR